MINKKLLSFDHGALRYVELNVLFQWLGMLCNVIFVRAVLGVSLNLYQSGKMDVEGVLVCTLSALSSFGPVGELGGALSGGERQRIGVARAFLHDAPFLLLDEPTSNLDSLNEGVILKAVRAECKDKTVLLVSHRKSTMAAADISFSVESGRLS